MGEKTNENLYTAFVGEAKAHFRLQAFAQKADDEGYDRIALLFRAVAEAERVHATRALRLLGDVVVKDTESNLKSAFESEEMAAEEHYVPFLREAEAEGDRAAAAAFSQIRDVEAGHANLYRHALQFMLAAEEPTYHVCQVCGYVAEGIPPDKCPVCGADRERFRRVQ